MFKNVYSKDIIQIIQKIHFFESNKINYLLISVSHKNGFEHHLLNISTLSEEKISLPENFSQAHLINLTKNSLLFGIYEPDAIDQPKDFFEFNHPKLKELQIDIKDLKNPHHYPKDHLHFKTFQDFFEKKWNIQIDHAIEYLEFKNTLIFSYYLCADKKENKLIVCNLNFEIIHQENLTNNNLIGYLTFQIYKNFLVYIKNKRQLEIYEIS